MTSSLCLGLGRRDQLFVCTELTIVLRREERGKTRASLISSERTCCGTGMILFRIMKCRTFGLRFVFLPLCPFVFKLCLICLSLCSCCMCVHYRVYNYCVRFSAFTRSFCQVVLSVCLYICILYNPFKHIHTHTHHTHTHTPHTHTPHTHTHTHTHTCTHTHTHTHTVRSV